MAGSWQTRLGHSESMVSLLEAISCTGQRANTMVSPQTALYGYMVLPSSTGTPDSHARLFI